jgi:hypothetical protein
VSVAELIRRGVAVIMLIIVVAACGATPPPSWPPTDEPAARPLLPLPGAVDGIPRQGDAAVTLPAHSPVGIIQIGVPVNFNLGHCGLGSPVDLEGGLWDPIAGDNGFGGPHSEQQLGELVNSTTVVLTLLDSNRALFVTPRGAVITLERHAGPRAYLLCM